MKLILTLFGVFIGTNSFTIAKPVTSTEEKLTKLVTPVIFSGSNGAIVVNVPGVTVTEGGDSMILSSELISQEERSPGSNNGINAPFINGGGPSSGNNGINAPFINGGNNGNKPPFISGGANGINAPFINGGGGSNGILASFVNSGGSNGINAPFINPGR